MNIKLFTHTDLDGVACAVLAFCVFNEHNVDVEYCDYTNINNRLKNFLTSEEIDKYSYIYITDISVNEDIAELIDRQVNCNYNIKLFDHHVTALYLNKYDWATVKVEDEVLECGASLFFKYLLINFIYSTGTNIPNIYIPNNVIKNMLTFTKLVRYYDTWEWKDKEIKSAKELNDLFHISGYNKFISNMKDIIYNERMFEFNSFHRDLLDINRDRITNYIESKMDTVIIDNLYKYNIAIVFAEQYISELASAILNKYDVDFVVIISPNGISFRTEKDIDLSNIAKQYGGGGHKQAAGAPIKEEQKKQIIKILLEGSDI